MVVFQLLLPHLAGVCVCVYVCLSLCPYLSLPHTYTRRVERPQHMYTYICIFQFLCECICICVYIYIYICLYIYIYEYMYINIYIHRVNPNPYIYAVCFTGVSALIISAKFATPQIPLSLHSNSGAAPSTSEYTAPEFNTGRGRGKLEPKKRNRRFRQHVPFIYICI